jgi:phosphoribosylamine--glycine ligase
MKLSALILGSGAREHALAWKISRSPELKALFCAPGNPGTAALATNVPVPADDVGAILAWIRGHPVDLVIVGPEAPLVRGVADALSSASIPVFGPSAAAAALEGSKAFAKEVMASAGIPTASARVFTRVEEAESYVRQQRQVVVKADGLAAGKGVVVAREPSEAVSAIRSLAQLGAAAQRLVIEEVLEGEEVSVIALCDGERFALLPPAQDHKRLRDGDAGPNTGGMGAYAPARFLDAEGLRRIGAQVIEPILREMRRRGSPFRGALYAGLMLTDSGPKVLEFNCRLGDPEAQVLMLQLREDLLPLLMSCAKGELGPRQLDLETGSAICVVLASEGYPEAPRTGVPITGLDRPLEGIEVFHAGTRLQGGQLVTSGGRVLSVCARRGTLGEARDAVYSAIEAIRFQGMHYRRDIGMRAAANS